MDGISEFVSCSIGICAQKSHSGRTKINSIGSYGRDLVFSIGFLLGNLLLILHEGQKLGSGVV